ncbi:hypothetical protein GPECTOR_5g411 [Gonium pectorale]|uniref:FAD synthase n=1 Tax=Gonium pectorale TaxID=33097 RepID=A0A150GXB9_GONPE|nr:hypothetical protein GPECTOR_5g411 [Gonium pectorale]|eukprot:KXZ54328.1 hypothetical protein GPECTOR_5g411 [Gonium pectorale]
MAAVLGWPDRLPLTAPQDRWRVLAGWSAACQAHANGSGSTTAVEPLPPRLRTLPFSLIRGMSPEEFVALLARDLGAAGVVAGRNYRFGFKAAGDADALLRLGHKYGMRVRIVDLVMLPDNDNDFDSGMLTSATDSAFAAGEPVIGGNDGSSGSGQLPAKCFPSRLPAGGQAFAGDASTDLDVEVPPRAAVAACSAGGGGDGGGCERVSSSRIRELLASGRVEAVEGLLGRKYRLVCRLGEGELAEAAAARVGSDHGGNDSTSWNGDGGGCESASALLVPYSAYQNQPPANGQYRALVRVLPADACGGGCEEALPSGLGDLRSAGAELAVTGAVDGASSAGSLLGPVCAMVVLGDAGMRVQLAGSGAVVERVASKGYLLLVDFDACE